MARRKRATRSVLLLAVLALLLGACTVQTDGAFVADADLPGADTATQEVIPYVDLIFEHGVTPDPCAEAVNPDNGCIHLGAIIDRSGPFAEVGTAAYEGAKAFWTHVNEKGGVFGQSRHGVKARFDVDITTYVADNEYVPEIHIDKLEQMLPDILALGLSHGTVTNVEALHHYKEHELVTVPLSWWSGWAFEPIVADTGIPYCLQGIAGLDYTLKLLGGETPFSSIIVGHTPGRYGQDVAKGVEFWSRDLRHQFNFLPSEHAVAVPIGGEVTELVHTIEEFQPEVVVVAIAPGQLAALAKEVAAIGWNGYIVGATPTFVPSLLEDDTVAQVLTQQFIRIDPYAPLSSHRGKAYEEMRTALGGDLPPNHFWIAGWMNQYPLLEAIKHSIELGDLTRPGLAHSIEEVIVHYDGGMRRREYISDVTDEIHRNSWIYTPDPSVALGEQLLEGGYLGNTVGDFPMTRPCSED